MKNLFKKISAILIAAVMVLAMASTAFATEATAGKPTGADSKQVKITNVESGATVRVPLFINEGETIEIDTRDGSYVGRVKA